MTFQAQVSIRLEGAYLCELIELSAAISFILPLVLILPRENTSYFLLSSLIASHLR